MDVMAEIMFDDADLFNIVQRLVIVFPLLADKLPCKLQLLLRLPAAHDSQGISQNHHIQHQDHGAKGKEEQDVPGPPGRQGPGRKYGVGANGQDKQGYGRIRKQQGTGTF